MPPLSLSQLIDQSALVESEPGEHLTLPPSALGSPRAARQRGGVFYIQNNLDGIVAYLLYLVHRYPNWPYLIRRACFPADRCLKLLKEMIYLQEKRIEPGITQAAYLHEVAPLHAALQKIADSPRRFPPILRIVRLHAAWIHQRAAHLDPDSRRDTWTIRVRAHRLSLLDLARSFSDESRTLFELQLEIDSALLRPSPEP